MERARSTTGGKLPCVTPLLLTPPFCSAKNPIPIQKSTTSLIRISASFEAIYKPIASFGRQMIGIFFFEARDWVAVCGAENPARLKWVNSALDFFPTLFPFSFVHHPKQS
jgi:hypothetical protein